MSKTFFGHPRGLATLFLTEMWERFTFYGMRAVLILFLVATVASGGLGLDDKTAAAIYGLYNAGVYLAALPGGWVADRLIGAQRAVMLGGLAITAGNLLLAISTTAGGFYIGLVVIIIGVGLLKPNVSAIVAGLYPEGGARLDSAFTIFYIGINVGAALGPLVIPVAQIYFGLRAGFGVGAVFMILGVAQFYFTRKFLGDSGVHPAPIHAAGGAKSLVPRSKEWMRLWIGVAVLVLGLAAVNLGWIPVNPLRLAQAAAYIIGGMGVLYFAYYFIFADLSPEERKRGVVLVVLFCGCALFFSGFEQAGSSMNLFAERYTDRTIGWLHFVIPTGWFQSLNSIFILLFAPFFAWIWIALARRNLNPSATVEIRARRDVDGFGIPGDGGGRDHCRSRQAGAALLADHDLSVAHLRRAVLEPRGLELLHQIGAETFRRPNDGHVVSCYLARQSGGGIDRRRIRRQQCRRHARPVHAHRVFFGRAWARCSWS